jgi:hypothetical protein
MKIGRGLLLAIPLSLFLTASSEAQFAVSGFGFGFPCFNFKCFIPCASCSLTGSWITSTGAPAGNWDAQSDDSGFHFNGTINFNSEKTVTYVDEPPADAAVPYNAPTWQGVWSFSSWNRFDYLVTVFRFDGSAWYRIKMKLSHVKDCNFLKGEYVVQKCEDGSKPCPKFAGTDWDDLGPGAKKHFFAYRLTAPHFVWPGHLD